jgi:phosphoglycerol transferase MdoB-like AlkP superfamily enzyme
LIKVNRVASFFKQHGYTFVAFDSGYEQTRIPTADIYMAPPQSGVSGAEFLFDMMFFDTTIGRVYMRLLGEKFRPLQAMFDAHRERILFTLDNLPNFGPRDGNYFIYAHIISPHVPYVFGPNGEPIRGTDPYTLLDNHPGHEQNLALYAGQVNYLNKLLMQTIDDILANSETTPIIIIQGDHSSKVFSGPEPDTTTRRKLLLPILNAYLLPEGGSAEMYASITPVNSFRFVLNRYFGTQIELLPDESYLLKSVKGRVEFCPANSPGCIP